MRKIRSLIFLLLIILPVQSLKSEIIILSACDDKQDEFLKNEYIFNLNELIMTRNYVYKEKTYQKYRLTDLSVKKLKTLVDNVHKDIKLHGKKIKSKIIGETVLIHLKDVNEVAYLRFASVYKEFSDVTDFEKEAAELN